MLNIARESSAVTLNQAAAAGELWGAHFFLARDEISHIVSCFYGLLARSIQVVPFLRGTTYASRSDLSGVVGW